jgi:hypothetical protein
VNNNINSSISAAGPLRAFTVELKWSVSGMILSAASVRTWASTSKHRHFEEQRHS